MSDVHGNLTALEAVVTDLERRGVGRVVCGGDLALGGCQPATVVDRIRELGWPGVVGNGEELLWRPDAWEQQLARAPKLASLLRLLFEEWAPATRGMLGPTRVGWLQTLPASLRVGGLTVLHASPGDLWRAPMPDATDEELAGTYGGLGAGVVVYGHIHRPFLRRLGDLVVVNAGSVGSSFDGDPRASYALLSRCGVETVRVEYDLEREVAALLRSDYPAAELIVTARRTGEPVAVRD